MGFRNRLPRFHEDVCVCVGLAAVTRPMMEMRGFRKIALWPGESRTMTFHLGPDELSYYGPDPQRAVEPGTLTVFIGGSSQQVKQTRFTVCGS